MPFGIASIAGVLAGSIPKVFEIFERKQDNKQELAVLDKTLQSKEGIEQTRLDMSRIEGAEQSYQASLKHDTDSSRHKPNTWFGGVLMDLINAWRSAMRPGIVSTFMGMYVLFKVATIYTLVSSEMGTLELAKAILTAWKVEDWAMLELGVSYYITNRGVEKLSGKK